MSPGWTTSSRTADPTVLTELVGMSNVWILSEFVQVNLIQID